ncbi:MAG: FkbH like protein [Myxococcales bacterium]|nr:FkbH like protein [Myxococcales bacterium]
MKAEIKQHLRAHRHAEALELILRVRPDDALDLVEYAADQLGKIPPDVLSARVTTGKRVAILGGATTQFLTPVIRLFAARRGLALATYESDFGLFEQEIWSESPALRAFAPDVIHFHVSSHNLAFPPASSDHARLVQQHAERFVGLYRAARERFGCPLVVNNFETGIERALGTLDATSPESRNSMIRALNDALTRALPAQVYVNDIEQLSAVCGKARWFDAKLWNETKTAVSFECQPAYADRLAATLGALFGKSKKCLVLDLDNTLWGGVIGDDGMRGIRLGAGHPEGEAFQLFQAYAKALKDRGVLLAVASKNELANAREPFSDHQDMLLREADISSFVANWEPKDGSLRQIARELNIGLDALVFFDDNPAERELVRSSLPEVTVVDVPADPSLYVRALDDANLFDTISVTAEDQLRGEFFKHNEAREALEAGANNYDDFLRRLAMRAVVEPITEKNLARTTQLINKTNQFNLTTRRLTEAEVQALVGDAGVYTSATRLDDAFGSNGLISVVIGRVEGDTLVIENWLMSCRVLKRGVEVLEMERLLAFCRERGLRAVRGRYLPTAKNALVSGHYAELGFKEVPGDAEGTHWLFDLNEQRLSRTHSIAT